MGTDKKYLTTDKTPINTDLIIQSLDHTDNLSILLMLALEIEGIDGGKPVWMKNKAFSAFSACPRLHSEGAITAVI